MSAKRFHAPRARDREDQATLAEKEFVRSSGPAIAPVAAECERKRPLPSSSITADLAPQPKGNAMNPPLVYISRLSGNGVAIRYNREYSQLHS